MVSKLNSLQKNFGLRIKELRAEREITQDELAELCGFFRTYMSRIESGLANPTLTTINALALALKVDIPQLFATPTIAAPVKVKSTQKLSRGRVVK